MRFERLHQLGFFPGLFVLAMLTVPVSAVHAQTTAAGPYYAIPSWDQTLPCTALANCPRFVVLSNFGGAAVLDRETGLVWERSAGDRNGDGIIDFRSWPEALSHCATTVVGNRKGWRLPTLQELATLVDPTHTNPSLPSGHPFTNTQRSDLDESIFAWSATSSLGNSARAWGVSFMTSEVFTDNKADVNPFWCVRGGQGTDTQ